MGLRSPLSGSVIELWRINCQWGFVLHLLAPVSWRCESRIIGLQVGGTSAEVGLGMLSWGSDIRATSQVSLPEIYIAKSLPVPWVNQVVSIVSRVLTNCTDTLIFPFSWSWSFQTSFTNIYPVRIFFTNICTYSVFYFWYCSFFDVCSTCTLNSNLLLFQEMPQKFFSTWLSWV